MKRNVLAQLKEGVAALTNLREAKVTLRTIEMKIPSPVEVSADPETFGYLATL
jgi:putative transcriptional regulator